MNDDRLTPEERAVIEAAETLTCFSDPMTGVGALRNAVDAYRKATAPPEPFEAFMAQITETSWGMPYPSAENLRRCARPVWRCTITPVERVR